MTTANTLAKRKSRLNPGIKEGEKARRNRTRELELARNRRRDLATWATMAIHNIRHRAKRRGLLCTISAADIAPPEFCPVLGIKLEAGHGSHIDSSPSVDRFYNDEGYTPDNVRVISHRANQLKRDATVDELRRILAYMQGESVS